MIQFCSYFYHYLRLIYSVNQYISLYKENLTHDIVLLDTIIERIKSCGSVAIKFSQWITPKLEIMYLDEENIITNDVNNVEKHVVMISVPLGVNKLLKIISPLSIVVTDCSYSNQIAVFHQGLALPLGNSIGPTPNPFPNFSRRLATNSDSWMFTTLSLTHGFRLLSLHL